METQGEALEIRIQRAWRGLTGLGDGGRLTLYLVGGHIRSVGKYEQTIGTYTSTIDLDEFRQHVFFVFGGCKPLGAGQP